MKKGLFCLIIIVTVLSAGLCSCGQQAGGEPQNTSGASDGATWQEEYDLGVRYLSEGNYEEAILAFTAAIEIDPKLAPAYVGRGDAYRMSGETEEMLLAAQADYETAIALDETSMEAYLGLAQVYILWGDYEKACEILTQGVEKTDDETLRAMLDDIFVEEADANGRNAYGATAFTLRKEYVPFQELTAEEQSLVSQTAVAVLQDDRDTLLALAETWSTILLNRKDVNGTPRLYTIWNRYKVCIDNPHSIDPQEPSVIYSWDIEIRPENDIGYFAHIYNQRIADVSNLVDSSYFDYFCYTEIASCPCVSWQWNGPLSRCDMYESCLIYMDGQVRVDNWSDQITGAMRNGLRDGRYITFREGTSVWSDGTVDDLSNTFDELIFDYGKCVEEIIGPNGWQWQGDKISMIADKIYNYSGDPDASSFPWIDERFW